MMRRLLMSTWPFHACLAAICALALAWHFAGWHWALVLIWVLGAACVAGMLGQGVLLVQAYRRLRESRRPKHPENHATSDHRQETLPI